MNLSNHRSDTQSSRPTKWRFRFSLLTFLLLVMGSGTFLGIWVTTIESLRRQWKAAEPLIELGVTIETIPAELPRWMTAILPTGQDGHIESVDFNRRRLTDEAVVALTQLPRLQRLYMERTYANDQHCVEIAKIKSLRRLALWGNQVSDRGAKLLASLPDLEIVDLTLTGVTWRTDLFYQDYPHIKLRGNYLGFVYQADGSEIEELAKLSLPVQFIELRDASDSDIRRAIDSLPSLTSLSLAGNNSGVTPVGLKKIQNCRRIDSVSISHSVSKNLENEVPVILEDVCTVFGPNFKKASIIRHDLSYLAVWLFPEDDAKIISPEIRLAIHSRRLLSSYFDGIEGLENVETLETEGFDPVTLRVLSRLPNLKHLSISKVTEIPEDYGGELAEIKRLESLELIARLAWNEFPLAEDFFDNWQSRDSLNSILLHHVSIDWDRLRPLLEFPNLERLMISGEVNAPRNFLPDLRKHFGMKENKPVIHPGTATEAFQNGQ
jgi:hypothetical protein